MAGLKELSKQYFNPKELDLDDFFSSGTSIHFLQPGVTPMVHLHDFGAMQEQIDKECETEVIQAIKKPSDRLVPIGGCPDYPMVIVDMLTREYNILYGFGEQRRGYTSALEKQGFKANYKVNLRGESEIKVVTHNVKFDRSFLERLTNIKFDKSVLDSI